MGFLDSLKNTAARAASDAVRSAGHAVQHGSACATVTLSLLPRNLDELKALPEADLHDPNGTAALALAALCRYAESVEDCVEMLNYLRGPRPMSPMELQFLRDRLVGKDYVPRSYFEGTSPQNGYTLQPPYRVTIRENPYSRQNEGYLTLHVHSSGADSDRNIVLRQKGSTGEWFLWELQCLSDIRIPTSMDPWV